MYSWVSGSSGIGDLRGADMFMYSAEGLDGGSGLFFESNSIYTLSSGGAKRSINLDINIGN